MKFLLSKDERESLDLRSIWRHQLTVKERELLNLYREARNVSAQNKQLNLRHKLQFALSKNRILSEMGDVEYQRPEPRPSNKHSMMMRVPGYKGTQFQFNSAGHPTEYPFHETEEWQEVKFESNDPVFRWSDNLDWLLGWNPATIGLGGQFPREMMPGTPISSIRVMTGYDLCKFQSKIMYETIAPYGGVVNHLINYTCGATGASIVATCPADKKLAQEATDWLTSWADRINLQQKVRHSCHDLLVQGIFLPRRWKNGRVTLIDPSWLRGPHNEIGQNPWSYGVLSPNWPYETETVGAYSLWYPSNEVEIVSPLEMTMGKLESTTSLPSSGKQSVPLNYKVRPLLLRLEAIISALADGEAKRQRITGVVSSELADRQGMRHVLDVLNQQDGGGGVFGTGDVDAIANRYSYDESSGFIGVPASIKFDKVVSGTNPAESGRIAYNKVATVISNSIGVAPWMLGADMEHTGLGSGANASLTAAEPTVKTAQSIQSMLQSPWEHMGRSELLLNLDSPFSLCQIAKLKIHIKLPNVEVRNMEELYDRLHNEMADGLCSPQDACAEMGREFEEQREKIAAAIATGWTPPSGQSESKMNAENPDTEVNNANAVEE